MPGTKLQEHSGSEKAWVYTTVDFADEEQKPELFCIRFASPESKRHVPEPDLQSCSMTLSPEALNREGLHSGEGMACLISAVSWSLQHSCAVVLWTTWLTPLECVGVEE